MFAQRSEFRVYAAPSENRLKAELQTELRVFGAKQKP